MMCTPSDFRLKKGLSGLISINGFDIIYLNNDEMVVKDVKEYIVNLFVNGWFWRQCRDNNVGNNPC